jgi:hypothetical protein
MLGASVGYFAGAGRCAAQAATAARVLCCARAVLHRDTLAAAAARGGGAAASAWRACVLVLPRMPGALAPMHACTAGVPHRCCRRPRHGVCVAVASLHRRHPQAAGRLRPAQAHSLLRGAARVREGLRWRHGQGAPVRRAPCGLRRVWERGGSTHRHACPHNTTTHTHMHMQVKKQGPLKLFLFTLALRYKQLWMRLGFSTAAASPLANRLFFSKTQVWQPGAPGGRHRLPQPLACRVRLSWGCGRGHTHLIHRHPVPRHSLLCVRVCQPCACRRPSAAACASSSAAVRPCPSTPGSSWPRRCVCRCCRCVGCFAAAKADACRLCEAAGHALLARV